MLGTINVASHEIVSFLALLVLCVFTALNSLRHHIIVSELGVVCNCFFTTTFLGPQYHAQTHTVATVGNSGPKCSNAMLFTAMPWSSAVA